MALDTRTGVPVLKAERLADVVVRIRLTVPKGTDTDRSCCRLHRSFREVHDQCRPDTTPAPNAANWMESGLSLFESPTGI